MTMLTSGMTSSDSTELRLWGKVDRSAGLDGCWPFEGSRSKGYGRLRTTAGPPVRVHRLVLSMALGRPLAVREAALHACDNPPCANPRHLRLGTQLANIADRDAKGRQRSLRGEANPRARLTAEQVANIRAALSRGEYQRDVAVRFGISQASVSRIHREEAWRF